MNKTLWSCLLSAACIAATTLWMPAQAAPSAGVRAPAQGADANERVQKRLSVLGEKLWGNGEVAWIGSGRLDDILYRRDEAAPETSIVYGLVEG